jgi:hypothetical protein
MFAFNVPGSDTPRSVARMHEFLNERQAQVRNHDYVKTGLHCYFHTLRLGESNVGRVTDTMAQLIDGEPQHEVVLHQETPAFTTDSGEKHSLDFEQHGNRLSGLKRNYESVPGAGRKRISWSKPFEQDPSEQQFPSR